MLVQPWVTTLFANAFDVEICAVLWDQIFAYGQFHLFRVALAICQVIEAKFKLKLMKFDKKDAPNPQYDEAFDAQLYLKNVRQHATLPDLLAALKQ